MAKYDYDENDKAYDSKKYDEHQYVCDLLKAFDDGISSSVHKKYGTA